MSSSQASFEPDEGATNSRTMRTRKRKSISSILKSQASPSRMALVDLHPNVSGPVEETIHCDLEQKKRRRSSRRVSFADTYQVKEFLKDSDAKELGLWNDSVDSAAGHESQQIAPTDPQRTGPATGSLGSVSVGPGHHITGLETLLSGPIKDEARTMAHAMYEKAELAVARPDIASQQQQSGASGTDDAPSFTHPYMASTENGEKQQQNANSNIKSSFLKTFMAATPSSSGGGPDVENKPRENVKSSFLQSFIAAKPSSSVSESGAFEMEKNQADVTRVYGQTDVDAGMEFTACLGNTSARQPATDGNTGEITRIFGGHGPGFHEADGMDMTTCMGGLSNTSGFTGRLVQPAAESTRIFGDDNTENMDLTTCVTGLEPIEGSRTLGRTLNTTTFGKTMDFTAVFGKFSDSAVANLPEESTGKLLGRIDQLLHTASESTQGELVTSKGDVEVLAERAAPDKENIYQSTVLETIHEASSSTASVSNVTSGERSSKHSSHLLDAREEVLEEADMEMTGCTNVIVNTNPKQIGQDQTKVFDSGDTAAMDMTTAIGGLLPAQGLPGVSQSGDYQVESRTSLVHSTYTTHTEMTTCIGELPEGLAYQKMKMDGKMEEKTRLFQSEDTACMDITTCVGGLRKESVPQDLTANEREHTRIYQEEDAARMELTACVGEPLKMGLDNKIGGGDHTHIFRSEDNAQMEMTECLNNVSPEQPDKAIKAPLQQSKYRVQPNSSVPVQSSGDSKFSFGEETRFFQSDVTANMELTRCNTEFISVNQTSSKSCTATQSQAAGEDTKVFQSDDTCGMELTTNHGIISLAGSHSMKPAAGQSAIPPIPNDHEIEKTRFFQSEETASMDITLCQSSRSDHQQKKSSNQESLGSYPKENPSQLEENTKVFTGEDTANMEMTTCMGVISNLQPTGNQQSELESEPSKSVLPKSHKSGDHTHFYHTDDTGNMEMTTCVGVVSTIEPAKCQRREPETSNKGSLLSKTQTTDDHTHFFQSEDTANMEMTTCVGPLSTMQPPKDQRPEPASSNKSLHFIKTQTNDDHTHFFQSEDTANMEITACIKEPPGPKSLGKNSHTTAGHHKLEDFEQTQYYHGHNNTANMDLTMMKSENTAKMDVNESVNNASSIGFQPPDVKTKLNDVTDHLEHEGMEVTGCVGGIQDGVNRVSAVGLDTSGDARLDKTSDTYTLSSPTIKQQVMQQLQQEQEADKESIEASDAHLTEGRRSDTFTIGDGCGTETLAATEGDSSGSKSAGSSSVQLPGQQPHESVMAVPSTSQASLILPDWVDENDEKGILDELPIETENTEDLGMMSFMKPKVDESVSSGLQLNASSLSMSNLGDLRGNSVVSVAEFLEIDCGIADLPHKRRSVMGPQTVSQPKSLAEFLEISCIIKPKADMFEWAINYLTPTVESLRETVKQQEAQFMEKTPALVTEIQNAPPQESATIRKRIQELQTHCVKTSKTKMKNWRLKMVNNTKAAMEDSCELLTSKITKLTKSVTAIDEHLTRVKDLENDLDAGIAELEQLQLPSEQERLELLENATRLETMTAELQEKEEMLSKSERERSRLEAEKLNLQEEIAQLEREKVELGGENGDGQDGISQMEAQLEEAQEEYLALQRFQEWRLQAFDENNFRFSFLQRSIILSVRYDGSDNSNAKLTDITLESMLADHACASARLAHSMFFSSITVEKLKSLYPGRSSLPQLLQHLSELVVQVRLLETEVSKADFWHPVMVKENRLTIEFSSLEAHAAFFIHLDMVPGQYPHSRITHSSTIKIGKISEDMVNAVLSGVQPGWRYVTRLVSGVEQMLKKHSS